MSARTTDGGTHPSTSAAVPTLSSITRPCQFAVMPRPKRVFMFLIRCMTVVVAVGFLAFYVARVRIKQNELFSSSKNLRALSSAEDQYFLEQLVLPKPEPKAPPPPPIPAPVHPARPASSPTAPTFPFAAERKVKTMHDTFRDGPLPEKSVTFSGSKSMSSPVLSTSDFFRFWAVPPQPSFRNSGLPVLLETLRDPASGAPSTQTQPVTAEPGVAPASETAPAKQ